MSEVIILDTHIWIWFITQEFEQFPTQWREIIETSEIVGISPVSCYEVALAQKRRRLQLPCATEKWLQEALEPSGITLAQPRRATTGDRTFQEKVCQI